MGIGNWHNILYVPYLLRTLICNQAAKEMNGTEKKTIPTSLTINSIRVIGNDRIKYLWYLLIILNPHPPLTTDGREKDYDLRRFFYFYVFSKFQIATTFNIHCGCGCTFNTLKSTRDHFIYKFRLIIKNTAYCLQVNRVPYT